MPKVSWHSLIWLRARYQDILSFAGLPYLIGYPLGRDNINLTLISLLLMFSVTKWSLEIIYSSPVPIPQGMAQCLLLHLFEYSYNPGFFNQVG